jgi:hypothetical protein
MMKKILLMGLGATATEAGVGSWLSGFVSRLSNYWHDGSLINARLLTH